MFLLVVGALMDIFPATVVVVPLIVPIAQAFGIHPVHLGIIFVANLELGYLTPPVGMNLFLSSYRFGKPVMEVARATLPMLLIPLILLTGPGAGGLRAAWIWATLAIYLLAKQAESHDRALYEAKRTGEISISGKAKTSR